MFENGTQMSLEVDTRRDVVDIHESHSRVSGFRCRVLASAVAVEIRRDAPPHERCSRFAECAMTSQED